MNRTDTFVSRFLRWFLLAAFCWKIFKAYGFGWGASAVIMLLATGSIGKRHPLVPVPGSVRVALELIIMVLGLIATYKTRGMMWLVFAIIITFASLFLSSRRFAVLIRGQGQRVH